MSIEKHKEKLIGLRKLKREAVARNTADQEESNDEEGIEGETEV